MIRMSGGSFIASDWMAPQFEFGSELPPLRPPPPLLFPAPVEFPVPVSVPVVLAAPVDPFPPPDPMGVKPQLRAGAAILRTMASELGANRRMRTSTGLRVRSIEGWCTRVVFGH